MRHLNALNWPKIRNFISQNRKLSKALKIGFLGAFLSFILTSCGGGMAQRTVVERADSLFISVRCVRTVTGLITDNFLLPGQKRTRYKMDYINETWPDTITPVHARKIASLQDIDKGFDDLVGISKGLQERSAHQLEQLKKLNDEINTGISSNEDLLQYLTFERKCADTLNRVLDTLVKRSIELSCKSQSL